MLTWTIALGAVGIEASCGYPAGLFRRIGHPVTWIGALVAALDRSLNHPSWTEHRRRLAGALACLVLLAATAGAAHLIDRLVRLALPSPLAALLIMIAASSLVAQRSLDTHVRAVARPLRDGDIAAARGAVAQIVGRDTASLDEAGVARAAIESLAENFSDGIVAPVVFLGLLGLPGGVAYKAINTADSMIGHRTPRHAAFGFAAAKLDDGVNLIPARLAALFIVAAASVCGADARRAWRIMWRDARGHASPNAGWPEAAMAGALGVQLGGPRRYQGRLVEDHTIGDAERPAGAATIDAALRVYRVACAIQALVLVALVIATWVTVNARG